MLPISRSLTMSDIRLKQSLCRPCLLKASGDGGRVPCPMCRERAGRRTRGGPGSGKQARKPADDACGERGLRASLPDPGTLWGGPPGPHAPACKQLPGPGPDTARCGGGGGRPLPLLLRLDSAAPGADVWPRRSFNSCQRLCDTSPRSASPRCSRNRVCRGGVKL